MLYDRECGLCDRSVRWLARRDRRGVLVFAPLQGETSRRLAAEVPGFSPDLSGMALVDTDTRLVWRGSDGTLEALRRLGGVWRVVSWLRLVPRTVREPVYQWIARHRMRWFGRTTVCARPESGRWLA